MQSRSGNGREIRDRGTVLTSEAWSGVGGDMRCCWEERFNLRRQDVPVDGTDGWHGGRRVDKNGQCEGGRLRSGARSLTGGGVEKGKRPEWQGGGRGPVRQEADAGRRRL